MGNFNLRYFTALLVLTATFGQNLAMAYDPVRFSTATSNQNQAIEWLQKKIAHNFEMASPRKQMRIVNRLEKRLKKMKVKLERQSDEQFQAKVDFINSLSTQTPAGIQTQADDQSQNEFAPSAEEQELLGDAGTSPAPQFQSMGTSPVEISRSELITKLDGQIAGLQNTREEMLTANLSGDIGTTIFLAIASFILLCLSIVLIVVGIVFVFALPLMAPLIFEIAGGCAVPALIWFIVLNTG